MIKLVCLMTFMNSKERKDKMNKEREYEKVPTAVLKLYLETLEDTYKKQESILYDLGIKISEVKREILMKSEKQKLKNKKGNGLQDLPVSEERLAELKKGR